MADKSVKKVLKKAELEVLKEEEDSQPVLSSSKQKSAAILFGGPT